ncbi:hypothetical protein [Enterobacter ludwigii]
MDNLKGKPGGEIKSLMNRQTLLLLFIIPAQAAVVTLLFDYFKR